jgi:hypothetical protein
MCRKAGKQNPAWPGSVCIQIIENPFYPKAPWVSIFICPDFDKPINFQGNILFFMQKSVK